MKKQAAKYQRLAKSANGDYFIGGILKEGKIELVQQYQKTKA